MQTAEGRASQVWRPAMVTVLQRQCLACQRTAGMSTWLEGCIEKAGGYYVQNAQHMLGALIPAAGLYGHR